MADYFEQTVVQQSIPETDMTPLERLLLSRIFQSERDERLGISSPTLIHATRAELVEALSSSPDSDSVAHRYVKERLAAAGGQAEVIDLDLSVTSWEFFLQDIVKRSQTLSYISVATAFVCTRMRPDGFGGMAILITADAIRGKSTNDLIEEFLLEAGLDGEGGRSEEGAP